MEHISCDKNGTNIISDEDSQRITVLRYLLSVLIVFLHCQVSPEALAMIGHFEPAFEQGPVSKWLTFFISQGIARGAVPLFLMFSAYFTAKKNWSYGVLLKKKLRSVFIPFVLWISFYLLFFSGGLKQLVHLFAPQLFNSDFHVWNAKKWLDLAFGYVFDEYGEPNLPGAAVQFWFLRDLMILSIFTPVLVFLIRKFPVTVLTIVTVLFVSKIGVHVILLLGLFFYVLGLFWGIYDIQLFEKIDRISWPQSIGVFVLIFVLRANLPVNMTLDGLIYIFAAVNLLKFSKILLSNEKSIKIFSSLSVYSFFLYAVHIPVLMRKVVKVWLRIFPMSNDFFYILEYFGSALLIVVIGTGIGFVLRKICPPFFALINGGRTNS